MVQLQSKKFSGVMSPNLCYNQGMGMRTKEEGVEGTVGQWVLQIFNRGIRGAPLFARLWPL